MAKKKAESQNEPEVITEDESSTVETNAPDDAQQGTVADQDVTGTAPASHAGDDVDTNAGK